jgi:beta-phosphoglucomutase
LHGKPHPEIYLKAAELIKAKPSECLVIEDSPAGIESAKKAGMYVVSLLSNHNKKANLSKADHQINNLSELPHFLRSFG